MSDILLQELTNTDLDWLVTTGEHQPMKAGTVLLMPGDTSEVLYLILEGTLAMSAPCSGREFAQLHRGDIIGGGWLFKTEPVSVTTAKSDGVVLAVPKAELESKLGTDVSFAAHFYRAIALILSHRIRNQFVGSQLEDASIADQHLQYQARHSVKEALFVFGELHDSDISWMMQTGRLQRVLTENVLLNMGRPVDALYIVLEGALEIATTARPCDPLSTCSHGLAEQAHQQNFTSLASVGRGGLPGIISFLDFQPLPVRIHAIKDTQLLTLSRQQVIIKLQEDPSFAARFYRVIATQTAHLLVSVTATECRTASESEAPATALATEEALQDKLDEEELDMEELQSVSEGGTKFDWMLRQLKVEV